MAERDERDAERDLVLARIQENVSFIGPDFSPNRIISPFFPANASPNGEVFQLPTCRSVSLNRFMSLPCIRAILRTGYKHERLKVDSADGHKDYNTPNFNFNPQHVPVLIDILRVHPFHPVMEIATIKSYKTLLDEQGPLWNGETAVLMYIIAVASVLAIPLGRQAPHGLCNG
jgi:hypothetical protein